MTKRSRPGLAKNPHCNPILFDIHWEYQIANVPIKFSEHQEGGNLMNFRQVHLDFHTSGKIPGIGSSFSKAQFQKALKTGHVNSVTVFSKCHHGWAYHPSKANQIHPGLDFDLLGAQIEAAHEIGVRTPVYLSAGFDEKMALRHPEWLVVGKEDGRLALPDFTTPRYHLFCFNSPYLDYLLAQIEEVVKNYDTDGIFLDIVGVRRCHCQYCTRTLLEEGKDPLDDSAVLELGERVYANYTAKVRETVDRIRPGLPVFHNSGHIQRGRRDLAYRNSHLELESLPTGGWGYDHFPLSARYVQQLGLDYLGMTGKFHGTWGEFGGFKHPNALRYEVSLAAANGAKSSIGDQLHPQGEMDMATYRLIGAAYQELEEKEEWLDNVKPVADIALFSCQAYSSFVESGQGERNPNSDAGAVRMLLEGHYLFDVIDAESDKSGYKVVILPDCERITPALREKLDPFLEKGGKILASGKSGLWEDSDSFAFDFGADYLRESPCMPCYFRPDFEMQGLFDTAYVLYSQAEMISLSAGASLGRQEVPYFNRTAEHFCSHQHTPDSGEAAGPGMVRGKDGIYIGWQVFSEYAEHGALISKRMVQHALDVLLGGGKTLETTLGAQGVATLMEQEGRYVSHLLYAVPVKRGSGVEVIEDITPVHDVSVRLRLPKAIKRVYLAPQREELPFTQKDGTVEFTVAKVCCHQMVVLE